MHECRGDTSNSSKSCELMNYLKINIYLYNVTHIINTLYIISSYTIIIYKILHMYININIINT